MAVPKKKTSLRLKKFSKAIMVCKLKKQNVYTNKKIHFYFVFELFYFYNVFLKN